MAINYNITGLEALIRNFNVSEQQIKKAHNKGKKKAAHFLLDKSVQIVPVVSSDLRTSGTVDDAEINTTGVVKVGYNTEYALRRHESPPETSPSDASKTWKFLEKPFNENTEKLKVIIEEVVRNEVSR